MRAKTTVTVRITVSGTFDTTVDRSLNVGYTNLSNMPDPCEIAVMIELESLGFFFFFYWLCYGIRIRNKRTITTQKKIHHLYEKIIKNSYITILSVSVTFDRLITNFSYIFRAFDWICCRSRYGRCCCIAIMFKSRLPTIISRTVDPLIRLADIRFSRLLDSTSSRTVWTYPNIL